MCIRDSNNNHNNTHMTACSETMETDELEDELFNEETMIRDILSDEWQVTSRIKRNSPDARTEQSK